MPAARRQRARPKPPLEYSILYTATLGLLAFGSVMVYSASSAESLLDGSGDPFYFLKRYLAFGAIGLLVMHLASRHPLKVLRRLTPLVLVAGFVLTAAVMVPGIGVTVNGATRWLGAGPIQFQPSELLKVGLVLYSVQLLAARPGSVERVGSLLKPLLLVVAAGCALLMKQPDMGTALVICFAIGALLIGAGVPLRNLAVIGGTLIGLVTVLAVAEPYRRERLMSFVDPWKDAGDTGFQAVQAMIAMGSGGFFGVGLGESVQKTFYLPEAHTDMILAIIGEELGMFGVIGLASLYGMIAYAGFRAAKLAKDRYSKLLAAGVTSLILAQATLNFFAVMGMAPLTGVPLPFVSYGNSNLIVLLAAMGLVLNVAASGGQAQPAARPRSGRSELRAINGGKTGAAESGKGRGGGADTDRRRRNSGARRAGAGRSGRAAG